MTSQSLQKRYVIHTETDPNLASKLLQSRVLEQVKQGKKLYIVSDSKMNLDMIEEALLKIRLSNDQPIQNQQGRAVRCLKLTSDTINLEQPQRFAQNPDQYLQQQQPDIVLGITCHSVGYFH